jgi:hypothetical protein
MTTEHKRLIEDALTELVHQGVPYLEVLAVIAGEDRDTGSFLTMVLARPNIITVYVAGQPTTTNDFEIAALLFKQAAMRINGELPKLVPCGQGEPVLVAPAQTEQIVEEVVKEICEGQYPGFRCDPDPTMSLQIAADETRAEESRDGEESGVPPRLDG